MASTTPKTSWADDVDELDTKNEDFVDENGIRTVIEYTINDEGKKVKITRRIKRTLQKSIVEHAVAERQKWAKFGAERGNKPGPDRATTTVGENVSLKLSAGNKAGESEPAPEENVKAQLTRAGAGKVVCRLCKGEHFTAKCPYKDTLAGLENTENAGDDDTHEPAVPATSSGGKYVPPSMRGPGGARTAGVGSTREELPTLRVTNISEDTHEQDLRELFGRFGRVTRVFIGRDRETGAGKGFAFVSFDDRAAAQKAMDKVHGMGYDNLILSVQWSPNLPSSPMPNDKQGAHPRSVPLVIVDGFLGGAGTTLWGDFERFLNQGCGDKPRSVLFASVGPVSSLHDRACELYYAIRGGTVDYGKEHGRIHSHSRHGRTITTALYPQWSRQHPLHFLGHSIGGSTILKLQFLLKRRHFAPDDHPDMILSVCAISSPFRGTQLVYTLGERTDAAPAVRPFSVGSLIAKLVHLMTYFSPFLPRIFDLHAECRSLSYKELHFVDWLRHLWSSDWAESRDATPFDVTFEAADEREANAEGCIHPRTYYRSLVASMTLRLTFDFSSTTVLSFLTIPLYLTSWAMTTFDFASLKPVPSFIDQPSTSPRSMTTPAHIEEGLTFCEEADVEYRANDGVVPVFSQWHPLPCTLTRCIHETSVEYHEKPEAGVWYVGHREEATHMSFVPWWRGTSQQKAFWERMGRWLRAIDDIYTLENKLVL